MKRLLILLFLTCALTPAISKADTVRDRIVTELTDDGFTQIRISRTLLGRARFVGTRPGARREIVVNPATGVILRDYLQLFDEGGGNGSGVDDDEYDYDDEYDDDDDDREENSGPGSSDDDDREKEDNSGPGSGDDRERSDNSGPGSSDDDPDDD